MYGGRAPKGELCNKVCMYILIVYLSTEFTETLATHYLYVVPENIHTTPTEGICHMTPPSPLDFPKFLHTPGILAISYWILEQISEFLMRSSHEEIGEQVLSHP